MTDKFVKIIKKNLKESDNEKEKYVKKLLKNFKNYFGVFPTEINDTGIAHYEEGFDTYEEDVEGKKIMINGYDYIIVNGYKYNIKKILFTSYGYKKKIPDTPVEIKEDLTPTQKIITIKEIKDNFYYDINLVLEKRD